MTTRPSLTSGQSSEGICCWALDNVPYCGQEEFTARTILLTGRPGVGKTTVIRKIAKELGHTAGGFYTAEIRERGQRRGFKIVTLGGEEGILAHVDLKAAPRVSRYGVNLRDLEEIGVASLRRAVEQAKYVIVDEIGKMELFSDDFRQAVMDAVRSDRCVIGTVMRGRHPWVERLVSAPQVSVLPLNEANRDQMARTVLELLDAEPETVNREGAEGSAIPGPS